VDRGRRGREGSLPWSVGGGGQGHGESDLPERVKAGRTDLHAAV